MKKKLISNQIINTEYIFYPSVTVCIDTAFKMYLDHEVFAEGNDHMMDTFKLLKEQHWKLNEIFYFVNQASSNNKGYPCMTMASSNDPGRPCSFPFTRDWQEWDVKTYNECTDKNKWCYTKVQENRSFLRGVTKRWGICRNECHA